VIKGVGTIPPNNISQRLFVLRGANMAITTDQTFTKIFTGTLWDPQTIVANWISGAFNTACAGGIYMGAAKSGAVVSPASQSYAALTGAGTQANAALQAFATTFSATPILSLTTGNTGALTCDIFIYGFCLD
jgi:hypothetical protein